MSFEEWFKKDCWSDEDECIAQASWNAAIEQAAIRVEAEFDKHEPWITPAEIRALSA